MQVETMNALIEALGAVSASAVFSASVLFAAKRVVSRKRLRNELIVSLNDIRFLLEVEKAHVGVFITQNGKDNKKMIREVIRQESDSDFSGKNTISQIKRKLLQLSTLDD